LAVSSKGDVYVASYDEDLVWRFTPDGARADFVRGLATPAGLSSDARSRLLIANRRTNHILAVHSDGRLRSRRSIAERVSIRVIGSIHVEGQLCRLLPGNHAQCSRNLRA
jgi:hypothetical protein